LQTDQYFTLALLSVWFLKNLKMLNDIEAESHCFVEKVQPHYFRFKFDRPHLFLV